MLETGMSRAQSYNRTIRDSGHLEESGMAEQDLPKDLFEFMQKMWNPMSFPIPGMMTPTLDPKEIEKKIVELRTVESWLKMNVGFVDMTIKTLELQKAALDSLATGAKDKSG
ncbi:MAG TPA: PhaM family polyhydroxyalkanoate granule multifunctional regulatory protein [Burkholderiales bacterium]|jgi:hypothetical protein|nr:PhaM family polyhydroxyalkanoate granule multifunctional regulatory protein [Burkholderiales bacterium]